MLYMKEQRARVIEECTLKESSAINKVLGQKWKELPRAEQDRYYGSKRETCLNGKLERSFYLFRISKRRTESSYAIVSWLVGA